MAAEAKFTGLIGIAPHRGRIARPGDLPAASFRRDERENSMTIEARGLFCLTEPVLCVNPGASARVVNSQSLTRGLGETDLEHEDEQQRDVKWWALQDSNLGGQEETVAASVSWKAVASPGDKPATR